MNISSMLSIMLQNTETNKPSLFPFPFHLHIIFSIIGLAFFVYRFFQQKRPYQAIMAVAIPISLLIWMSDSKPLFYTIGICELILLISAFVTSIIFKNSNKASKDNTSSTNDNNVTEQTTEGDD